MKLGTLKFDGGTRAVRIEDDLAYELPFADVGALLATPDWIDLAADASIEPEPFATSDLTKPVLHPSKIFCLGLNYKAHIEEMGREMPEYPTIFDKLPAALIGPYDPITLPAVSQSVDWEVELAVIIGKRARHVSGADAEAAIAGFTILNDTSARDYQRRTLQWLQGKTFEGSTPFGPVVVTADELGAQPDLELRSEVDGELMQQARTSDLLFPPAQLVSYISDIITLEPGDLIATGTPAGVGDGRDPKVFLEPGQVVRCAIEGIGEIINTCIKEEL